MNKAVAHFAVTLVIAVILAFSPGASGANPEEIAERDEHLLRQYDALLTSGIETRQRIPADAFRRAFNDALGPYLEPDKFPEYTLEELSALHAALDHLLFYASAPAPARLLGRLSDEIESRGAAVNAAHLEATYEKLIESRLFEEAFAFTRRHRGKFVPSLVEWEYDEQLSDAPAFMEIVDQPDIPKLVVKTVNLSEGSWVIVETDPRCAFSRQFIKHLENDASLSAKFSAKSIWLVRQGGTIPIEPLLDWNRQSAVVDLVVSYKDEAWPSEITFALTPVFSFVKDGNVVHQVMGWEGRKTMEELLKGFARLGELQRTAESK